MSAPVFVIFGITGDLSKRKLLPALYHLFSRQVIPDNTKIIGVSRNDIDENQLLSEVELCVLEKNNVCNPDGIARLKTALEMFKMDIENPADYQQLGQLLDSFDSEQQRDRLFYMSVPPSAYQGIVGQLGEANLNDPRTRLLIEKPFGHNTQSAGELSESITRYFAEQQLFRIDHYLAKETAQNLLTFRMSNPIFTKLWDDQSIKSIHVRALETIGVENRIDFYESTGALRDVLQGHLLQLLSLIMMKVPDESSAQNLMQSKAELLESISPANPSEAVRAQYEGYKAEAQNDQSTTETYVKLQLHSAMQGWQNTQIVLETGKASGQKTNDIEVVFSNGQSENKLKFQLQPNEGITLSIAMKQPGFESNTEEHVLDVLYSEAFDEDQPDAYERVLVDAVKGDRSLFAGIDEIMASWRIVEPLLDAWAANGEGLLNYTTGTVPITE